MTSVLETTPFDSPGERWGRHWLDVVRFAESSGGVALRCSQTLGVIVTM